MVSQPEKTDPHRKSRLSRIPIYASILYVIAVLAVDLLATYRIPALRWTRAGGFDTYKFLFWFILPLIFSLRRMDWHYFTFRRWKRIDLIFLAVLAGAGLAALLLVPRIPELRAIYPDLSGLSSEAKWHGLQRNLLFILSWLPGWEFLHRYVLVRAVATRWPRFGWLLVPLSEGLYHLSKPAIEALGMTLFSLVATQWTLRRRNMLLPFFAHAAIELGLQFVLFL